MKCKLCSPTYSCEECSDKRDFKRLSPYNKVKLMQYKPYLDDKKKPDKEMFELMNYFMDNNIETSIARFLQ
jgi:hypothetical protein